MRHDLAREIGIRIRLRTVQRAVEPLRRELCAEAVATVRYETAPGQQLQIDFGSTAVLIGERCNASSWPTASRACGPPARPRSRTLQGHGAPGTWPWPSGGSPSAWPGRWPRPLCGGSAVRIHAFESSLTCATSSIGAGPLDPLSEVRLSGLV